MKQMILGANPGLQLSPLNSNLDFSADSFEQCSFLQCEHFCCYSRRLASGSGWAPCDRVLTLALTL